MQTTNYTEGIGSFWRQFFRDTDVVEMMGAASFEVFGAMGVRLADTILALSHKEVSPFRKERWREMLLQTDPLDIQLIGANRAFSLPSTVTSKGLRRTDIILPLITKLDGMLQSSTPDYTIHDLPFVDGRPITKISFTTDPLPGSEKKSALLWMPEAIIDENTLWGRYGFFTKDWRFSSSEYKHFIRGMLYAFMFGPSIKRMESGVQLMAGVPVSSGMEGEVVKDMVIDGDIAKIVTNFDSYEFNKNITSEVKIGDALSLFQSLSNAVEAVDYIIKPRWWRSFITQPAPKTLGNFKDIHAFYAAMERYLKYNTFAIVVDLNLYRGTFVKVKPLMSFLYEFKPSHTYSFLILMLKIKEPKFWVTASGGTKSICSWSGSITLSDGKDLSGGFAMQVVQHEDSKGYLPPGTLSGHAATVPLSWFDTITLNSGQDLSAGLDMQGISRSVPSVPLPCQTAGHYKKIEVLTFGGHLPLCVEPRIEKHTIFDTFPKYEQMFYNPVFLYMGKDLSDGYDMNNPILASKDGELCNGRVVIMQSTPTEIVRTTPIPLMQEWDIELEVWSAACNSKATKGKFIRADI